MVYGILGGDARNRYVLDILKKENEILVYKDEGVLESENVKVIDNLEKFACNSDVIITSIPFSRDGENIYAPFVLDEIKIKELAEYAHDKIIIGGSIKKEAKEELKKNKNLVVDLMEFEEYEILNAIATSEGLIKDMIEKSNFNLNGSNTLILGYGKCGKQIVNDLKALNVNVCVCVRKLLDKTILETKNIRSIDYGYLNSKKTEEKETNEFFKNIDFVINTVPSIVLNSNNLNKFKKDVLIFDIASMPGGIDLKVLEELNMNRYHLLGIPGKIAPFASAKIIVCLIKEILRKEKKDE